MNNKRKALFGKVISNKMNKTITVIVIRKVKHHLYGKFITRSTKYHVHDEKNECKEGDLVEFYQSKPFSKTKHWSLFSIKKHNQY